MLKYYRVYGPQYCAGSTKNAPSINIEKSSKDIVEFFIEKIHEKYPALEIKKELIKVEKSNDINTVQVLSYEYPEKRESWTIIEITLISRLIVIDV